MEFWGCSRYPKCDGIVNIAPDTETADSGASQGGGAETALDGGGEAPDAAGRKWLFPREVGMEGGVGSQVRAFQSNQQTEGVVDAVYADQIDGKTLALASQWRLEFPRPRAAAGLDGRTQTLLAVVQKLLARGSFAYTTPAIEEFIQAHSSGTGAFAQGEVEAALRAVAAKPTCPYEPGVFDSDAEEEFAEWFLDRESSWGIVEHIDAPAVLGEQDEAGKGRRIDFLLVSPGGDAIAVEVGGAERSGSSGIDAACAGELRDLGFEVFRVSASEARKNAGPNLDRIAARLSRWQGQSATNAALALQVRLGKLAHQAQAAIVEALLGGVLRVDGPWTIGLEPPCRE